MESEADEDIAPAVSFSPLDMASSPYISVLGDYMREEVVRVSVSRGRMGRELKGTVAASRRHRLFVQAPVLFRCGLAVAVN